MGNPAMDAMMQNMLMGATVPPEDQRMMLARAMALKGGASGTPPGMPPRM
jgi:hypothetical protein